MNMDAVLGCFGGTASIPSAHVYYSQNVSENPIGKQSPWATKLSADSSSSIEKTTIRRDVADVCCERTLAPSIREELTTCKVRDISVNWQSNAFIGPVREPYEKGYRTMEVQSCFIIMKRRITETNG